MTRATLVAAVASAEAALVQANLLLEEFDSKAENNIFETLEKAEYDVEGILEGRAHKDCEGSYNCGAEEYTQEFMVDGVKYIATLKVEYNRHDKTYYYIDETDFSYVVAP